MSFLSILLVASAFYFAHARPDSQSWPESYSTAQSSDTYPEEHPVPAVPEESPAPKSVPADYQHQLYGFMEEISKAVDHYMTPLMSKLEKPKQDELKSMGMDGFASYINYWLILIEEKEMEEEKSAYSEPHEEYLSYYHPSDPDTPYIADTQHDDDEEAAEE